MTTPVANCKEPDCGAVELRGRLNRSDRCCGFDDKAIPWAAQLYSAGGECLRLQAASKSANLSLVAVAPATQRAFRSRGSPATLKIETADEEAGWFLVHVGEKSGGAVNADFTLKYSRYKAGNPNCKKPTVPVAFP